MAGEGRKLDVLDAELEEEEEEGDVTMESG